MEAGPTWWEIGKELNADDLRPIASKDVPCNPEKTYVPDGTVITSQSLPDFRRINSAMHDTSCIGQCLDWWFPVSSCKSDKVHTFVELQPSKVSFYQVHKFISAASSNPKALRETNTVPA